MVRRKRMADLTVLGTGTMLPFRTMTNMDLEKLVDTSDEWITARTGIKTRRVAGPGEHTSELAVGAARKALDMAGVSADALHLIIVATITPEVTMPSCACLVQDRLGATQACAFDLSAACSGFLYGLDVAAQYVRNDPAKKILVIGAETLSTRVDWQDRNTCILFGDGAGAAVVSGSEDPRSYFATELKVDGSLGPLLSMHAAPSRNPAIAFEDNDGSYIRMNGREVFRHAVRSMETAIHDLLQREHITMSDIDLFIPHQANIRILNQVRERFVIPEDKVYLNVSKYGNTSAASVPIALDEANRAGRISRGDLLLFCTFGGGVTWGAGLLRW